MKIIKSIQEVLALNHDLAKFIMFACPWIVSDWEPKRLGYVFVLDDDDIDNVNTLCVVPHIHDGQDDNYKESMTINLETFDLWEPPIKDSMTGFWSLVSIIGQEYGASVFISPRYAASMPALQERLKNMHEAQS